MNKLTPRLTEVADLMCEGLSNKEIAYRLGISQSTVRNEMTELYRRLEVSTRGQAMSLWIKSPDDRAAASLQHALAALDAATSTVRHALAQVTENE